MTNQTKLIALVLGALIIAGGAIAVIMVMQPTDLGPSIDIINKGETELEVTLSEMKTMNVVERDGSFQNSYGNVRDYGTYKGVKIADLINLVDGMETEDVIIVNATDGYSQMFTYQNVYPNESIYAYQGDLVLAFSYNGTEVPEYEQGYRIMFLPEDGYFSNADANASIDDQFFSGAAGPKCVQNVATIQVADRPEPSEPSVLDVKIGSTTESFTMAEILAMDSITGQGGFKNRFGTIVGPSTYTGVPVFNLLKSVASTPFVGNFELHAVASDGYTVTYNQTIVKGTVNGYDSSTGDPLGLINCTMILAYYEEGDAIEDGPLRIVFINDDGNLTDSFLWAKMVVNLTVVIETPAIFVTIGDETKSFSMDEIMNLPSLSGYGGYKKSSGTIVGPYNYTGVSIHYLLSMVDALPADYTLEVIADDGYKTYFNSTHVEMGTFQGYDSSGNPIGPKNFSLVIAYYEDGVKIPVGGPLRIVLLNDDGYLSDGHWWAKFIVKLNVVDQTEPWELELAGVETWKMPYDTYYSLASCDHHRTSLSHDDDHYEGVPLYVIVAAMDGGDDEHYLFNTTLLSTNYNVTLYDSNGNNVTINCWEVTQNTTILVAGWMNGLLLSGEDWPLKLVSKNVLLGNIVKAELEGWDE